MAPPGCSGGASGVLIGTGFMGRDVILRGAGNLSCSGAFVVFLDPRLGREWKVSTGSLCSARLGGGFVS